MIQRQIEYWVIPPEQDAEFVACMEDVLEIYAEACDPPHPVVCHDLLQSRPTFGDPLLLLLL